MTFLSTAAFVYVEFERKQEGRQALSELKWPEVSSMFFKVLSDNLEPSQPVSSQWWATGAETAAHTKTRSTFWHYQHRNNVYMFIWGGCSKHRVYVRRSHDRLERWYVQCQLPKSCFCFTFKGKPVDMKCGLKILNQGSTVPHQDGAVNRVH